MVRRGIDWGAQSDSKLGLGPSVRCPSHFDDTPLVGAGIFDNQEHLTQTCEAYDQLLQSSPHRF